VACRAKMSGPSWFGGGGRMQSGRCIGRVGSMAELRALIDLGIGLWYCDPWYGRLLQDRGKHCRVPAHRAKRIAYAPVRNQTGYHPTRWA
jgi:hypothetical protein